jgi:hypothetical protein
MNVTFRASFYFATAAAFAWGQSRIPLGSEPSPMEAFASGQDVRTIWSNEIADLNSDPTRVVITAVILRDHSEPARIMRGVKIDLSNGNIRDRIYLDETAIERTRSALDEIATAVAQHGIPGGGCMGAREFWPNYGWEWNKYHELNADVCGGSDQPTLVLSSRGRHQSFPVFGAGPARLASILQSALEQVRQH